MRIEQGVGCFRRNHDSAHNKRNWRDRPRERGDQVRGDSVAKYGKIHKSKLLKLT